MTNRERLLNKATSYTAALNQVLDDLANEHISVSVKLIDVTVEKDAVKRVHISLRERIKIRDT